MKKRLLKSKLLIFVFGLLFIGQSLQAQDNVEIDVTIFHNRCTEDRGVIKLDINPTILDDYSFPFTCEWENLTTGDYEELELTSLKTTISHLKSGIYQLFILLDDHCEIFIEDEVKDIAAFNVESTVVNSVCDNGSITLDVTTELNCNYKLDYIWSNGVETQSQYNLTNGIYTVTITPFLGSDCGRIGDCTEILNFEVVALPSLEIAALESFPSCPGMSNGSVKLSLVGSPELPIEYKWSNGTSQPDLIGVSPGEYCVTVTDGIGCSVEECVTVESLFTIQEEIVGPTGCGNDASISIFLQSSLDCGFWAEYLWSNGETTSTVSGLSAGTYTVTVTPKVHWSCGVLDECTFEKTFTIENPQIVAGLDVSVFCLANENTGSMSVLLSGQEVMPVTYMWSNGKPLQAINNLSAGEYCVTVMDASGCVEIVCETIENGVFSINEEIVNPNGCSGADGSISLQPTSTNANCGFYYSYQWDYMDKTTASIDELAEGTYTVTITSTPGSLVCGNIQGCSVIRKFTLSSENGLTAAVKNYENFEDCEFYNGELFEIPAIGGNIDVDIVGGVEPYSFQWTFNGVPFATSQDIKGEKAQKGPGLYTLIVTDANGCTDELEVELCCCSYESYKGEPKQSFLCSTATSPTDPGQVNFTLGKELKSATTATSNDGEITVLVNWNKIFPNNSTPEVHYYWTMDGNYISDKKHITGLSPGTYKVVVSSGCISKKMTVVILDCEKISANMEIVGEVTNEPCLGYDEGVIEISKVNGGAAPYTYRWSTGSHSSIISNLAIGTYTVTVTDAGGCGSTESYDITTVNSVSRIDCQVFCGTEVVESFLPIEYAFFGADCLKGKLKCSDGYPIPNSDFQDNPNYKLKYDNFSNSCGIEFTCPKTGGVIKTITGTVIDDSDFVGEHNVFEGFLYGSVTELAMNMPNAVESIVNKNSELKKEWFCGQFEGCKFTNATASGEDIYYQYSYFDHFDSGWKFVSDETAGPNNQCKVNGTLCENEGKMGPTGVFRCCRIFSCKGNIMDIECADCPALKSSNSSAKINSTSLLNTDIMIIPNPTFTEQVAIVFDTELIKKAEITIFNLVEGKPFYQRMHMVNDGKIDLNIPLVAGVYFVSITDQDGNHTIKKLIRQ